MAGGGGAIIHMSSRVCVQVAEGLMHMHRNRLVHADVKPENLLLCSYVCTPTYAHTPTSLLPRPPHAHAHIIRSAPPPRAPVLARTLSACAHVLVGAFDICVCVLRAHALLGLCGCLCIEYSWYHRIQLISKNTIGITQYS